MINVTYHYYIRHFTMRKFSIMSSAAAVYNFNESCCCCCCCVSSAVVRPTVRPQNRSEICRGPSTPDGFDGLPGDFQKGEFILVCLLRYLFCI